ncbi:hypothetical protein KAR91_26945 [Candidatus Pacearchaeota archaeon]|nr:hypothetical protein [Candidatus Pacearchaeota archaeon]
MKRFIIGLVLFFSFFIFGCAGVQKIITSMSSEDIIALNDYINKKGEIKPEDTPSTIIPVVIPDPDKEQVVEPLTGYYWGNSDNPARSGRGIFLPMADYTGMIETVTADSEMLILIDTLFKGRHIFVASKPVGQYENLTMTLINGDVHTTKVSWHGVGDDYSENADHWRASTEYHGKNLRGVAIQQCAGDARFDNCSLNGKNIRYHTKEKNRYLFWDLNMDDTGTIICKRGANTFLFKVDHSMRYGKCR